MVCSTCGYENQIGNRFCGMCGTPLPHRPLTAPGAQNTASLTHALGDSRASSARGASDPTAGSSLDVVPQPDVRDQGSISLPSSDRDDLPSETPRSSRPQRSEVAAPQFDLVPEIPLDEYVRNFRYVPPSDPEEITMRGDTAVLEAEPPAASNATPVPPAETATESAEIAPTPLADDVRERLGLEVTAEERTDRPRFLDFNEPTAPPVLADSKPEASATPIAGPSFLGLSDVSQEQAATADELAVEEPAHGKWRIWLAAAVILALGFLGLLEWRAQVHQTNSGPVEVIEMKMRNLTRSRPPESAGTEPALSAAPSDSSKPEMQVEPSPQPQNQNPPANTTTAAQGTKDVASVPNTGAATATPASSAPATPSPTGNQPIAGQSTAKQLQSPTPSAAQTNVGPNTVAKTSATTNRDDKSKLTGSQPAAVASVTTRGRAKPSPQAADDDQEVVVKKIVPGTDEVAKADNASDSAAAAAWLWKAAAKGNPAAPVRLADMYIKGDGVPRSCEQAMVLLKTAAEKENAPARNRLASMYGSGTCVQRNRVEAYRWLSSALAANPNSEWAQQRRDQLWQQMTPEERTLAGKYK